MLFLKKKITYILKNSIYERELESFHFEKKKITSSPWKNENHLLEEKRGRLWKCYGKIIPKELMFQRFTSVSDGYTCFYVIMYSISMDSAYKPFYCKAATDFFSLFLLSVPVFYDSEVSGAFWIDFRLFEILE